MSVEILEYDPKDHAQVLRVLSEGVLGTWTTAWKMSFRGIPNRIRLFFYAVLLLLKMPAMLVVASAALYEVILVAITYWDNGLNFVRNTMGKDMTDPNLPDFTGGKNQFFVAKMGEKVMGCIARYHVSESTARLRRFAVDPDARNLGVGTSLGNKVKSSAQSLGYRYLTVDTHNTRVAAMHVYSKLGFVEVNKRGKMHLGCINFSYFHGLWDVDCKMQL